MSVTVPIGDVAIIQRGSIDPRKHSDTLFELYSIAGFDDNKTPEQLVGSDIGSSKTVLPTQGVLFSKLNPRINRVWTFRGNGPANRIASTEFVCLVPDEERLQLEYLGWRLRVPHIVDELPMGTAAATKSRERIQPKSLLQLPISLPPLHEQRRIVGILNRAAKIERLRARAADRLREFIPALFVRMFGDPVENPMGWDVRPLGAYCILTQYGTSKKATNQAAGLPVLRMGNVTYRGDLDCTDLKWIALSESDVEKHILRTGDILFNRTNSKELVGKTGIWDGRFEAVAASYFIRLRLDETSVCPTYVWAFMNSQTTKQRLFESARGAIGQANINAKELKSLLLPVPPLDLQHRYAELVETARSALGVAESYRSDTSALQSSLMSRLLDGVA